MTVSDTVSVVDVALGAVVATVSLSGMRCLTSPSSSQASLSADLLEVGAVVTLVIVVVSAMIGS